MLERNRKGIVLSLETGTCGHNGEFRPFLEIHVVKISKSSSETSVNPENYSQLVHDFQPLNCNG